MGRAPFGYQKKRACKSQHLFALHILTKYLNFHNYFRKWARISRKNCIHIFEPGRASAPCKFFKFSKNRIWSDVYHWLCDPHPHIDHLFHLLHLFSMELLKEKNRFNCKFVYVFFYCRNDQSNQMRMRV